MIELYLRPILNRLSAVTRTAGLSVIVQLICFTSSYAQTLVPELVFTHAQLKTGYGTKPAGADGAIYIFQNVTSDVDAIVTITGRSSNKVTLSNIDLTGPSEDVVHGTGYDNAWQPRVAYNGGTAPANTSWWMEFQVSFAQHTDHAPISVSQFYVTGLDVDGDGQNLHEYLCFYKQQSYTLEQNSDISPVSFTGCISDATVIGRSTMARAKIIQT